MLNRLHKIDLSNKTQNNKRTKKQIKNKKAIKKRSKSKATQTCRLCRQIPLKP